MISFCEFCIIFHVLPCENPAKAIAKISLWKLIIEKDEYLENVVQWRSEQDTLSDIWFPLQSVSEDIWASQSPDRYVVLT